MKISADVTLGHLPVPLSQIVAAWGIVLLFTAIELASSISSPSVFGGPDSISIARFIDVMADWVPVIGNFKRCNTHPAETGLFLLALSTLFFPAKLLALLFAHPPVLHNAAHGFSRHLSTIYVVLISLVATTPVVIFYGGWLQPKIHQDLSALKSLQYALCAGGFRAFTGWTLRSSFALLGLFVAVSIWIGLLKQSRELN